MLTMREFQIASKILAVEHSIRIIDLSEEFNVSSRTIKYDMERVRSFFEEQGANVSSQPGKGIWIDCSDEERLKLLNVLSKLQRDSLYFNQEARTERILLYLLLARDFVTANELAEYLKVSRNTILSDMEVIVNLLKENNLELNRKNRNGYRIEGSEIIIRTFFEGLIQKNLSVYDVSAITNRIKYGSGENNYEFHVTEELFDIYPSIETALIQAFSNDSMKPLMKDNIILIIIRLLLSIERIKLGCNVGSLETIRAGTRAGDGLYPYLARIYEENQLPLLRDEFLYIEGNYYNNLEHIDIAKLTAMLIDTVSEKEKFPYYKDTTLYSRLLSHLTISLTDRKSNFMENPFQMMIKKNHITIYMLVKEVCQRYIGNDLLLTSESFISYIVLHFLVTQKTLGESKKFKAIFVCATGRGAARLIEKMLESEIKEIEVAGHCSLLEVDEAAARIEPDFIISVFPIKANVPVIVVEPLPTKENIRLIKKIIADRIESSKVCDDEFENINFNLPVLGSEDASQKIIITGLSIYNAFLSDAEIIIKEELKFAFLTHIMLFAHRHYFGTQYKNRSDEWCMLTKHIKARMDDIHVDIEKGEIDAIINYIRMDEAQN